jgi:signal transduction histidine kinase/ActR/RegA family two-component response regulator
MITKIINYPKRKIMHTIILLFGVLIVAIIANAMYTCININRDMVRNARKDMLGRLNIAKATHDQQIEKLKTISLMAKEQNQKFCNFLDYDNVPAVTYMLKSLVTIHDVDFAAIFDENTQLVSAYPKRPAKIDAPVRRLLIGGGDGGVSLFRLPAPLVAGWMPLLEQRENHAVCLCFRSVIPLLHDTGDLYGHVILVKMVNGNRQLMTHMNQLTEAQVTYFDKNKTVLLTSFNQSIVPFPSNGKLSLGKQQYLTAIANLLNDKGELTAYLAVAKNNTDYFAQQWKLLTGTLFPFVLIALTSIVLFVLLKRRVFDKVHMLSRALRDVSGDKKDMSIRIPVGRNGQDRDPSDEVEYMCLDFNQMMDKLENTYSQMLDARKEVEAVNLALEERVKERTAQLFAMYKDLEVEMEEHQRAVEQKRTLEKSLEQARKMEAIGTLAGGIAHDFNNILTSVLGFTELALYDVKKGSKLEINLQEVYAAGKRAKDLVKQILVFARQSDEEIKPVQPRILLKEVVKFMRSSIPSNIEIKHDIKSASYIMGNPTRIYQIFMNLCANAAYAMENDGGVLELNLTDIIIPGGYDRQNIDLKQGHYLEIKVSDTGTGISPEIVGSIFEPYFTTKGPGEGTGMGLAMVQGIVEACDGKIFVDSILGKGTTFSVYLPTTEQQDASRTNSPETLPKGTERILFIDDEATIARMGGQILERLGYSVTARTDGVEAVALFKSNPKDFDLVISDMTMPVITGDELAIQLMKIRQDIPVILVTGYNKNITEEKAAEIGIKAFSHKPIVMTDLAKTVRKVLDASKAET